MHDQVQALVDRLSYAGNEAARKYLNGEIDRAGAVDWLFAVRADVTGESRAAHALLRHVPAAT